MFDIFGNKKKDELLRYIDAEIEANTKALHMNFEEIGKLKDNSLENIKCKEELSRCNREILAVRDELTRIRKVIERIYS